MIWGRKKIKKELGRVADFCSICRKICSYKFMSIVSVRHFFRVPVEEGIPAGNQIECEECHAKFIAEAVHYKKISKNKEALVDQLILETNPDVEKRYASRLLIEAKAKSGEISEQARINFIREALILGASVKWQVPEEP